MKLLARSSQKNPSPLTLIIPPNPTEPSRHWLSKLRARNHFFCFRFSTNEILSRLLCHDED